MSGGVQNIQRIANTFVMKYYTILHANPNDLVGFYGEDSQFSHADESKGAQVSIALGLDAIQEMITTLRLAGSRVKLALVDSQSSMSGGIVIMVLGKISSNGAALRRFSHTFFLAPQDKGFYVLNDVFRYLVSDAPVVAAQAPTQASVSTPPSSTPTSSTPTSSTPTPGTPTTGKPAAASTPSPDAAPAASTPPAADQRKRGDSGSGSNGGGSWANVASKAKKKNGQAATTAQQPRAKKPATKPNDKAVQQNSSSNASSARSKSNANQSNNNNNSGNKKSNNQKSRNASDQQDNNNNNNGNSNSNSNNNNNNNSNNNTSNNNSNDSNSNSNGGNNGRGDKTDWTPYEMTLYVSGLPTTMESSVAESQLRAQFKKYGELHKVSYKGDFAFVEFKSREPVSAAIESNDQVTIGGRRVKIDRRNNPRGAGGGKGGKRGGKRRN